MVNSNFLRSCMAMLLLQGQPLSCSPRTRLGRTKWLKSTGEQKYCPSLAIQKVTVLNHSRRSLCGRVWGGVSTICTNSRLCWEIPLNVSSESREGWRPSKLNIYMQDENCLLTLRYPSFEVRIIALQCNDNETAAILQSSYSIRICSSHWINRWAYKARPAHNTTRGRGDWVCSSVLL